MKPIAHEAYAAPATFQQELERIFQPGMFVATADKLAARHAYVSYLLGDRAVSVRNTGGGLAAFENICLHRGSLIDPPGHGQGPMRCRYHGWMYDADGALRKTATDARDNLHRCTLPKLHAWDADGLIFSGAHPPEDEDAIRHALTAIGHDRLPPPFHEASLEHPANWKLLVENVVEQYHISFVHPQSFVPMGISSTTPFEWSSHGRHSWSFAHVAPGPDSARMNRLIPQATDHYAHAYVFPNLFVSLTSGLVAYVAHFIPDRPDRTVLHYQLHETPLLMRQSQGVRDFVKSRSIEFTEKVLAEDLELLGLSQAGVERSHAGHQIQPGMEPRIAHFHARYREAMHASE